MRKAIVEIPSLNNNDLPQIEVDELSYKELVQAHLIKPCYIDVEMLFETSDAQQTPTIH